MNQRIIDQLVGLVDPRLVKYGNSGGDPGGISGPNNDPVTFQILSWHIDDVEDPTNFEETERYKPLRTRVMLTGVDDRGRTVAVCVNKVTNYFFIDFPRRADMTTLVNDIRQRLGMFSHEMTRAEIVELTNMFGFHPKAEKFLKLTFKSIRAFNKGKDLFMKWQHSSKVRMNHEHPSHVFRLFETNVNPLNRFCHLHKIPTTGWVTISEYSEGSTNAQVNIETTPKSIKACSDSMQENIADITIVSWDIECLPEDTEKFPDPRVDGDQIVQVSLVFHKFVSGVRQKFLVCSRPCNQLKDATLIITKTEKRLIETFVALMQIVGHDIWVGYNTWGFDENYMWVRGTKLGVDFSGLSCLGIPVTLKSQKLSSSAFGDNEYKTIECPGHISIDVMDVVRKEKKSELTYFGLDDVAMHYLKTGKDDVSPRQIFDYMSSGDPTKVALCGNYCVMDSVLALDIFLSLTMLPNIIEMAKTTWVPITWLLFRGQQCKVFSLIVGETMSRGFVIPVLNDRASEFDKKAEGATVMTARAGLYMKPIVGVDFGSLYPSIMASLNMCHSTFIMDEETMCYVVENKIPYVTKTWVDTEETNGVRVKNTYSFVQYDNDKNEVYPNGREGIIRVILLKLWKGRTETKAKMALIEKKPNLTAAEKLMLDVLNGKQLSQKITMNSVYGFTLPKNGIFPMRPIGETTTYMGREMIKATAREINEKFGGVTIYGDSIPGSERITVKTPGSSDAFVEPTVQDFADSLVKAGLFWEDYRGFKIHDAEIKSKSCINTQGLGIQAYTHEGFVELKKIIRHKTHKKLLRIRAVDDNGRVHSVIVTEGHSLIAADGSLLAAENARVGDELLKY